MRVYDVVVVLHVAESVSGAHCEDVTRELELNNISGCMYSVELVYHVDH